MAELLGQLWLLVCFIPVVVFVIIAILGGD